MDKWNELRRALDRAMLSIWIPKFNRGAAIYY